MRRLLVPAIAVLLASGEVALVARADTTPIQDSPDLPWTNPAHQSSVEVLAAQIASTIAGRPVGVHCEGDTDWRTLLLRQGGNPDAELGYVSVGFKAGQPTTISGITELAGQNVCLPLKTFATATTKPTKCLVTQTAETTTVVTKRVKVTKTVVVGGKRKVKTTWVKRRVPTKMWKATPGPLGPCYSGDFLSQIFVPGRFWNDYDNYAMAIWTLAHEAIHLGGIVGSRLTNGTILGDPLAEAKANCYGLQWVRYVAEQLGDTPDDAQAIAQYAWEQIYPRYRAANISQYWSDECRPGGALDMRPPGTVAWP